MSDPINWPPGAQEAARRLVQWCAKDYADAQATDILAALAPFVAQIKAAARDAGISDGMRAAVALARRSTRANFSDDVRTGSSIAAAAIEAAIPEDKP